MPLPPHIPLVPQPYGLLRVSDFQLCWCYSPTHSWWSLLEVHMQYCLTNHDLLVCVVLDLRHAGMRLLRVMLPALFGRAVMPMWIGLLLIDLMMKLFPVMAPALAMTGVTMFSSMAAINEMAMVTEMWTKGYVQMVMVPTLLAVV